MSTIDQDLLSCLRDLPDKERRELMDFLGVGGQQTSELDKIVEGISSAIQEKRALRKFTRV